MFEFAKPYYLLLLWAVPLLCICRVWFARRKDAALAAFIAAGMQSRLVPAMKPDRNRWQTALAVAGLALGIIALARPQWGERDETVYHRGRDLVIALDVSRSMLANDVHPNRLQRARIDLVDLIDALEGDRIGLVAFRHRAELLCPLTSDYAFLKHALDGCGPHSAPPGETDIGSALDKCLAAFDNDRSAHKAIVLISDGEDLQGKAMEAAERAAAKGIPVFAVGIGNDSGSRIPNTEGPSDNQPGVFMRYRGEEVLTRLNNETLDRIAAVTGGAYIPIATASTATTTLGELYKNHLSRIAEQDLEETLQRRKVERFQWFLLPASLCFLAVLLLSRGRLAASAHRPSVNRRAPTPRLQHVSRSTASLTAVSLLCLTTTLPVYAQEMRAAPIADTEVSAEPLNLITNIPPGRSGARMAQSLYGEGRFAESAQAYIQAAEGSTRNSARDFLFNAAVASYHAGDYATSADILQQLTGEGRRATVDLYSALGHALFQSAESQPGQTAAELSARAELLRSAGEAFREAARQKPGDPEAAGNLAVSLKTLEAADEEAGIAALLEKYGQASAGEIAAEMLAKQRAVKIGMMEASTNSTPSRIDAFENLADEQQKTADLWIPLKRKLLQAAQESGSDESRMTELNQQIESTREAMQAAASQLQDLETTENAQRSEITIYQIWKAIAPYDSVLQENLRQQSNNIERIRFYDTRTIADLQRLNVAAQQENQTLTPLFRERFELMLEQGASAQSAPVEDGMPAGAAAPQLPPEDIETIRRLADTANTNQLTAVSALAQEDMDTAFMAEQAAYSALREIEKLLPKPPPQEDQQEQSESESPGEQPQEQNPENADQEEPPEDAPEEDENQPEPEPGAAEEEPPQAPQEDMLDEDVANLLERALEREREHEQERREKLGRIPLAPSERDW